MIGTSKYGQSDIAGQVPCDVPAMAHFLTRKSISVDAQPEQEIAMASQLKGRKVAFLATDGVEQVELTAPWNALKQAGADVMLVSDKSGEIQSTSGDAKGEKFHVDLEVSKV